MHVSGRLIAVAVFVVGGLCQVHSSLYCQRLVPSAVTSAFSPCRFPCRLGFLEAPFNIVIQSEPDGTPCRIPANIGGRHQCMGRCNGGACLDIGNYHRLELLKWGPSFREKTF
ncbi:uncharacterized protein LOC125943875 isoform X2 [Dermacentor silvarum]|uniref:uncharacterized protein LOC125943875 isoform X2 n=1 Tax=Dermacentor silvarum TaxID=543639 RepID=UPI002101658D|nr:uncharacterized protein LOC125943875 isoform X2 [Dermacentor silvarum]